MAPVKSTLARRVVELQWTARTTFAKPLFPLAFSSNFRRPAMLLVGAALGASVGVPAGAGLSVQEEIVCIARPRPLWNIVLVGENATTVPLLTGAAAAPGVPPLLAAGTSHLGGASLGNRLKGPPLP